MAYTTTYVAEGNREDLSNVITNIAVTETPLFSMFGRATATGVFHEWLEDTLRDPKDNAMVEGADYTIEQRSPRVRKGNYTQIFSQGYGVSGTQEAVLKAGVKSEIAYQMALAMKEVARDVEYAYINNAVSSAGSATTARKLGGIPAFVSTNVLDNGGTARPLTEDLFNDGVQAAWQAGGNPDVCVCSGKQKRVITGFTTNVQRTLPAEKHKQIARVDVYESDFGVIKIVADRFMPDGEIFILSSQYWKTAYLRPFKTEDLPVRGDRKEKVIIGELTLEARAEKASAIIKDLA